MTVKARIQELRAAALRGSVEPEAQWPTPQLWKTHMLTLLLIWIAISIPVGLVAGRFIAEGEK